MSACDHMIEANDITIWQCGVKSVDYNPSVIFVTYLEFEL